MDRRASAVPEVPVPAIKGVELGVRRRAILLLEATRGVSHAVAAEIMHEVEKLLDFADDLQAEQAHRPGGPCLKTKQTCAE
jgi:hypothetical protein